MSNESPSEIKQRIAMVEGQLRARGIVSEDVLNVMGELPRQCFIPPNRRHEAYLDQPVPIGHKQTISQPYIVALMTESLQLTGSERILEIGTGCGYQTAILARLAGHVCTVEIVEELGQQARENIKQADPTLDNVEFHVGDGRRGWPGGGQFERILVAAAAERMPGALITALADAGRMVAPIGSVANQQLLLFQKKNDLITETMLCYCRFVKLI